MQEEELINKIKAMLGLNMNVTDVARAVGISRQTLYRKIAQYGITYRRHFQISIEELREVVVDIKTRYPSAGEVFVMGHLRSRQIVVQRRRVRALLHDVDGQGISERRTHTITRRQYWSPCPNYVWHIDGLHKLIRWKFVIHGSMDGFSRLITFLNCSVDNRASTVLNQFQEAVQLFGWPLHVRTDLGGENTDIWRAMTEHHHTDNAVIVGSSVHNERVERMWRDINRVVSSHFREQFFSLEAEGLLNPLNEADLFCLHWVYLDLVNMILHDHQSAHNHHSVSTEQHYTPLQLYHTNLHLQELHQHHPDSERTTPSQVSCGSVTVESLQLRPSAGVLAHLTRDIPRDAVTMLNAKAMYQRALHCLGTHTLNQQ
uniref:Integrase catalytic domain-containing protein n=1 Tax=Neogobius melanostomus TaxID=47308 RepID=A0A8C6SKU6_9GOBI